MTTEQAWLVAAGVVALAALLVAVLAWRTARLAVARLEDLAGRPAEPSAPAAAPAATPAAAATDRDHATPADASYVITGLDAPVAAAPVAAPIDGRLFTDLVARETVVRAASWSRGIRRALAPESRNRIAFQVRQQAKQRRRDRRTEVREALREYRARRADDGDAA